MFSAEPLFSYNDLPSTFVESHLMPHLDARSVVIATSVSKQWYHLFVTHDKDWRRRIIEEFNIPENLLVNRNIVKLNIDQVYKKLYSNLMKWFKEINQASFIGTYCQLPHRLPVLIACCLNHADYAAAMVPRAEETLVWIILCHELDFIHSLSGLNKRNNNKSGLQKSVNAFAALREAQHVKGHSKFNCLAALNNAIAASDLIRTNALLNAGVIPDQSTLKAAITAQMIKLIRLLLTKYGLTPTEDTLCVAAFTRNIAIMELLLTTSQPNIMLLAIAARNGDLAMVKLILSHFLVPIKIDHVFNEACLSGNLELINYLRNHDPSLIPASYVRNQILYTSLQTADVIALYAAFSFGYDQNTLNIAASRGRLQLVEYLINEENLAPTNDALLAAIHNNHMFVAAYLLKREFNLVPTFHVFRTALHNDSFLLMQLLMEPRFNHAHITIANLITLADQHSYTGHTYDLLKCDQLIKEAFSYLLLNDNKWLVLLHTGFSRNLAHSINLLMHLCLTVEAITDADIKALMSALTNNIALGNYLLIDVQDVIQILKETAQTAANQQKTFLVGTLREAMRTLEPHCHYKSINPAAESIADTTSQHLCR